MGEAQKLDSNSTTSKLLMVVATCFRGNWSPHLARHTNLTPPQYPSRPACSCSDFASWPVCGAYGVLFHVPNADQPHTFSALPVPGLSGWPACSPRLAPWAMIFRPPGWVVDDSKWM